jgi:diaminohydroxyphosphoribosylaminopyrimidine deaminase / 5-amino-6-(5-phosphoribosylamino)uracil reductase
MNQHIKYLARTLQLANMADNRHFPNPKVGSVVVHNDIIIGEGFHEYCGGAHAEVNAVNSVKNCDLLAEATIYVSLEPCNHTGKTPPCTEWILKHKIPKVVIGCLDPNPKVAGKGVVRLRENGVEVIVNEDTKAFEELNKSFFINQLEKRPFISLKWAESKDGFISGVNAQNEPVQTRITNEISQSYSHFLRATHQAIFIGANTARIDNPQLTTRRFVGKNPIRLVLDKNLNLPTNLKLFTDGEAQTIILNAVKNEKRENLHFFCPKKENAWENVVNLTQSLYEEVGICNILVEGGTNLLQQFIDKQRYDQVFRFVGGKVLQNGLDAPELPKHFVWQEEKTFAEDRLQLSVSSYQ